jgi:hypothetical protein
MRRAYRFHIQRFSSSSSTSTATKIYKENVEIQESLPFLRQHHHIEISKLPEVKAREKLRSFLEYISKNEPNNSKTTMTEECNRYGFGTITGNTNPLCSNQKGNKNHNILSADKVRVILDASIASFHLHVESRVAALCGKGYYTIGNS